MEQYLKIGTVTSVHGVHGEVKVYPTTDDPRRFDDLDEVILERQGMREIHAILSVKHIKNMVVLKLSGIDTVEDAQRFRSYDLFIPREKGVPLGENEYYIADMLGMDVFTEDGNHFGKLKDVIQTGANDVYDVRSDDYGEVLIPAIKACIISVDVEKSRMTVHLLPGLVDEKRRQS
ncbi:MAG: ribosome maturation factor RimM [Eubacteriales bacterium]|jgi:16S rRNA processing protein RimM